LEAIASLTLPEGQSMSNLTLRNLDNDLEARLRLRAARHGQSMEEEARSILQASLENRVDDDSGASLYAAIRARVERFGGHELALSPRGPQCHPPDFSQ
jgi:plasmid stability protein